MVLVTDAALLLSKKKKKILVFREIAYTCDSEGTKYPRNEQSNLVLNKMHCKTRSLKKLERERNMTHSTSHF